MIECVCKYTSEMSNDEISDYSFEQIGLTQERQNDDFKIFNWLFSENIYGESIHTVVYNNGKPVARRSFWRNDLEDGYICYQPIHTYVEPEMRRKGIFSRMTQVAIEKARGSYIYNFPNENSAPGYLKLGWKVKQRGLLDLYFGTRAAVARIFAQVPAIPSNYLNWRFVQSPNKVYSYTKVGDVYLLLKQRLIGRIKVQVVVGRTLQVVEEYFNSIHPVFLFSHQGGESLVRVRKTDAIVVEYTKYNDYFKQVWLWRSDTI